MTASSLQEFAEFNGLLGSVVERGLKLEAAMDVVIAHSSGARRRALEVATRALKEGTSLPDALALHPRSFPPEYCALVRAGVQGGRLAEVLRSFETYYAYRARMARKLGRLVLYFGVGILLCIVLFCVVVMVGRQFYELYRQIGVAMPAMTTLLMGFVRNVEYVAVSGAVFAGLLAGAVVIVRRSALAYRVPVWSHVQRSHDAALFCTVMALRLRAGAPLPEALEAAEDVLGNRYARGRVREARMQVLEGVGLSTALQSDPFFPHTLSWAVGLGERRGDVPDVFATFSDIYTTELQRNSDILLQVLMPAGLILYGHVIFITCLALFLPLISILDGVGMKG